MLGYFVFWLIAGGELDWPIIRIVYFSESLSETKYFSKFYDYRFELNSGVTINWVITCNRISSVTKGLEKAISDLYNLHLH